MKRTKLYALLFAGTTTLVPSFAFAQPQAIAAMIIPFISTAGVVGAIGFTGTAMLAMGIGYAVTAAALYGLSTLVRPDVPAMPRPEDGKFNIKQAVPSLAFVLGKVRKGGDYIALEEKSGTAYHVTVLAGHRIKGVVQHWLHDKKATLDGSNVTKPSHFVRNGDSKVLINTRRGLNAETAYSQMVAAFPTIWTNNHRGDGLASVLMRVKTVANEHFQKTFPNQMPQHTATIEGSDQIFDPRDGTYKYTENLALFRLWHLTHPVGGKLTLDDMYLPEWSHVANICDQNVTNRSGGAEKRYHGGFWFRANNNPVEVGRLIDQAAELVVYERPDGKVGVHGGEFLTPTVRLDRTDILALSFDTNRRLSSNVLAVKGKYTSPENGYSTVDAAPYGSQYVDDDDTERVKLIDNHAVQSHNHMARLEKLTYIRANAPRVQFIANYLAAKAARTKRFVRVHYPPRMDEAIVELTQSPKISLSNLTIEFSGIVVPPSLYDFNAATDEGVPGSTVIHIDDEGIPTPTGFDINIRNEVVSGGSTAAYAEASWDFVDDSLTYELEWQLVAGGEAQRALSSAGEVKLRSHYLADGASYRFRLRAWAVGNSSEWTTHETRTATADPVAPGVVSSVTKTEGVGQVLFEWNAPNSANYYACRIYIGTTNVLADATLAATEYGPPSARDNRTITSLPAGTYYAWLVAINPSGKPASAVATGVFTIT